MVRVAEPRLGKCGEAVWRVVHDFLQVPPSHHSAGPRCGGREGQPAGPQAIEHPSSSLPASVGTLAGRAALTGRGSAAGMGLRHNQLQSHRRKSEGLEHLAYFDERLMGLVAHPSLILIDGWSHADVARDLGDLAGPCGAIDPHRGGDLPKHHAHLRQQFTWRLVGERIARIGQVQSPPERVVYKCLTMLAVDHSSYPYRASSSQVAKRLGRSAPSCNKAMRPARWAPAAAAGSRTLKASTGAQKRRRSSSTQSSTRASTCASRTKRRLNPLHDRRHLPHHPVKAVAEVPPCSAAASTTGSAPRNPQPHPRKQFHRHGSVPRAPSRGPHAQLQGAPCAETTPSRAKALPLQARRS